MRTVLSAAVCALAVLNVPVKAGEAGGFETRDGGYVEVGGTTDPSSLAFSVGYMAHIRSSLFAHAGLQLARSEAVVDNRKTCGLSLGSRICKPRGLAPFVGLGVLFAWTPEQEDPDGLDNDGDGIVDESDEWPSDDGYMALCPEFGLQLWRGEAEGDPAALSLSARYNITDQGSDSNYWLFSLGFVFLNW